MTGYEFIKTLKCCNSDFGCMECVLSHGGTRCKPEEYSKFIDALINFINQKMSEVEQLQKLLDDKCDRCIAKERTEAVKEFKREIRAEINEALKSNYQAKQQRIDRLDKKGIVCHDEFCSYCDGKIHALYGIGEFIHKLLERNQ